jgi:(1->4)-alpha-D-glucan 1-alpha-D-glucosylmutase
VSRREPLGTYRLQVNARFTLDDAAAIAPYLARLGVSHVYTSPILQAAPGSTHGYDCVDYSLINGEIGGQTAYEGFREALRHHGLGHLLDIVPNHMATALPHNRWWWDVLEKGRASPYAEYFDLYWDKAGHEGREVIILPVLGDHLSNVLEAGDININRSGASFYLSYHQQVWPVAPHTLAPLLDEAARRAGSGELARAARSLAEAPDGKNGGGREGWRQERLRGGTAALLEEDEGAAAAVDEAIERINASPPMLGAMMDQQHYRLAHWMISRERLGYRRFFDINGLIGLRVEDLRVFEDVHRLVIGLVHQGAIDGLRIDHIDGLRDPAAYLRRLAKATPGAWLLVEKILEPGERLRRSWPIAGTTGYDFLNKLSRLFVDPVGEKALSEVYTSFTGEERSYDEVLRDKKLQVLREVLGADVERLVGLLAQASVNNRLDFVREEIREALREVAACFPTYRSYVWPGRGEAEAEDSETIDRAVRLARENRPDLPGQVFDFIADPLLLKAGGTLEREFAARFQQLTGPAMAKGAEDTAFYCYNRLLSLNEVGGSPGHFGVSIEEFHHACIESQKQWPLSMLAAATHDTKRGEDARVRISLLSETLERWREAVLRWPDLNEGYRKDGLPDRNMEYFFYQTLVGAWPLSLERAWGYIEKAAREAKAYTSWTRPNYTYESALKKFVQGVLSNREFITDLEGFLKPLMAPSRISSLAQTLIKMTSPGVPDIYQGAELWDFSLVDPDNRRPVDFGLRAKLLAQIDDATPEAVLKGMERGLPKLWVIQQALKVRRRYLKAFGPQGSYGPVFARGAKERHVVAYRRGDEVLVAAPRLSLSLGGDWGDTSLALPDGVWRNQFTGETWGGAVEVKALFHRFPVALLYRVEAAA